MLVKNCTVFVLTLALMLTPAFADSHVLDVPGPSLVVLESKADADLVLKDGSIRAVVLEASPSHLIVAAAEAGVLVVDGPEDAEITVTRVRVVEHDILLGGAWANVRSFYPMALTKEEDHDFDPDPKMATERPLVTLLTLADAVVTKEEDHDFDPDPDGKRGVPGPGWAGDWAVTSAAVSELGPGWYLVVRGGEVTYEALFQGR